MRSLTIPSYARFRLLLPILIALPLAGGLAPVDAEAADRVVTVQPIQLRNDDGSGGVIFELLRIETDKILEQAGIRVEFIEPATLDRSEHVVVETVTEALALIDTPGNGQHPNTLVVNMWFVDGIEGGARTDVSVINDNGIVVDANRTVGGDPLRYVLARAICCNLGLFPINGLSSDYLMFHGTPDNPPSVADIQPDGQQLCKLNQGQIDTIRASVLVTQEPVPEPGTSWGRLKVVFE